MRLILVSGLSGSGKSVALHMLEDAGFYCVDNIPAALLKPFISHTLRDNDAQYSRAAVGVDARNAAAEIETVPPLDAFGAAGTYDRAALSRLFGGRRTTVARGWTEQGERFESITLISPHPDATLRRLVPGTLVIRHVIIR